MIFWSKPRMNVINTHTAQGGAACPNARARELLGTIHNGGSGAANAHGLRITMLRRAQTRSIGTARRLPGQRQRQTRSSAAQPPSRGIQAESSFLPSVFQLSALRTSSPLDPAPFRRNAVSRSSSPSNCPNSRPCVSTTLARVLRSSASSNGLRSTRLLSLNPLFSLRRTDWRSKPTTPRPAISTGSPFQDPPALECHRCLPAALGAFLHFNNRFGGSRAFLSLGSPTATC